MNNDWVWCAGGMMDWCVGDNDDADHDYNHDDDTARMMTMTAMINGGIPS